TFALVGGGLYGPQADAIINGVFREFLRNGVTSIRDVGAAYPWIIDLARSVEEGRREGPRIFAAGPILTAPGGHPAGTLLRGNQPAIAAGPRQLTSPEQARTVVRDLAAGGVDVIKAVFDSRGRSNSPERIPTLDPRVLGAIVAEARAAGLSVTVHWGNVDELPAVVAAGAPPIGHSRYAPIPPPRVAPLCRPGIAVRPSPGGGQAGDAPPP